MQLLADHGDEGSEDSQGTPGLGFVPGRVQHLRTLGSTERMPHVGWNAIRRTGSPTPLLAGIPDGTDFYFVHSYAFTPQDKADEIASATCGIPFAAALQRDNIWGTQFHPEKSSRAGFRLLKNFLTAPQC
ncbi:hypothetical protein P775_25030 [Puniceibacterium antarcticum]|uniref:Glutamine amidotransferase domain-containing protein n=2 Tax=Puniceibacterium antarcticum TaxID=1206336 RepID=A0A2G8R472_9RHOB|nr:hypothetical protein P775_25030 [Puniceibacterium antarcticum]